MINATTPRAHQARRRERLGEVNELLDEFGIVLVPRVEELQLPTREVRLDAFDASELRRGVPYKLVGDSETGEALAFA